MMWVNEYRSLVSDEICSSGRPRQTSRRDCSTAASDRNKSQALPTTAKTLEDALAQARARDEEIARSAQGATYAGDADPYRHDDEDADQTGDAPERPGDGVVSRGLAGGTQDAGAQDPEYPGEL